MSLSEPFVTAKHPPNYYKSFRNEIAAEGRTAPRTAENTKKCKVSLLKKWDRFCTSVDENPEIFFERAQAEDLKTFMYWITEEYNIKAGSTLCSYFRLWKIMMVDKIGRSFDEGTVRDINNYINKLIDLNNLRRLPKRRGVSSVDDLCYILYFHWVFDDTVFCDERQRIYVATGLLMASYSGCRPVSMFDTRIKFDDDIKSDSTTEKRSNRLSEDDTGSDSGTDDEVDAGFDLTKTLLWRHIQFFIARPDKSAQSNLLFAKVTYLHTKGEGNRPRVKTFIVDHEENPLLCLLDHLLSLAFNDDVFASQAMHSIENVLRAEITPGKKSMQLRLKKSVLDLPVFREPERGDCGKGTSSIKPLRANTWLRYLKRLGEKSGLEQPLTQYCARRGLVNAINHKAPSSVRDQIFDHRSRAVDYYLDSEVRWDTQAAFLDRPSNDILQNLARQMTLTADPRAPTTLSKENRDKLARGREINRLRQRSQALTKELKSIYGKVKNGAPEDPRCREKDAVDAALHRINNKQTTRLLKKARKQYFRHADTKSLDIQFNSIDRPTTEDHKPVKIPIHELPERRRVVDLLQHFSLATHTSEDESLRKSIIEARVALGRRRETAKAKQRRLMAAETELPPENTDSNAHTSVELKCHPRQCIFCLGDERKTWNERVYPYSRTNKMLNEVDRHLARLRAGDPIACPHPHCKADKVVLPDLKLFKNHVGMVHGIKFRA